MIKQSFNGYWIWEKNNGSSYNQPIIARKNSYSDLQWASGSIITPHGVISVGWRIENKNIVINYNVPSDVNITFKANKSHKGYHIELHKVNSLKEFNYGCSR
ncbi:MAG: alpha-L-rhamnosidase C-terminal domain-containing protein [Phycisphaerales bacterium]